MREATDHFGRKFRDMPPDNWAIDTGQFPEITPEGVYVPPSGMITDKYPGLYVPDFPPSLQPSGDVVATSTQTGYTRFVPKRDYSIVEVVLQKNGVTAGNVQFEIERWIEGTDTTEQLGLTAITAARVTSGPQIFPFANTVELVAGDIYFLGYWGSAAGINWQGKTGLPNIAAWFQEDPTAGGAAPPSILLPHIAHFADKNVSAAGLRKIMDLGVLTNRGQRASTPYFALREDDLTTAT